MVAVKGLIWGPSSAVPIPETAGSVATLSDADNAVGFIFMAPKTGNIDQVAISLQAENGTSPAYNVGVYTVDASGNPTQTVVTTNSFLAATFTSAGVKEVALTAAAEVTQGGIYCVHVFPTASTPNGSNHIVVETGTQLGYGEPGLPIAKIYTTSWSKASTADPGSLSFGFRYDDEEWFYGAFDAPSSAVTFDSADSPDEAGAVFQVPIAMTISGLRLLNINPPAAGDTWTVTLYSAADSTLATITVDADITTTDISAFDLFFASSQSLSANTNYRLAITNSSATNTMQVEYVNFGSANQRSHLPDGARWAKTTRTNAGAWTDDTTMVPCWGLIVSELTTSSGSGFSYGSIGG